MEHIVDPLVLDLFGSVPPRLLPVSAAPVGRRQCPLMGLARLPHPEKQKARQTSL